MVKAHGATWSWSGDVPEKHSGPFSLWLRVNGRLHCDLEFLVRNDQDSNLAVDVRYKWSQIKPCPEQLKGCSLCPTDKCHREDVAVCDGSPYWECLPKEAVSKLNSSADVPTTQRTTATWTTLTTLTVTTTTSKPLSLDDLMKEPQVQSLLREEERVNSPKLPSGPLPTSHPAVAATEWRNSGHVTRGSPQATPGLPWVWGYSMAVLALCSGCLAAMCISSSSRPSEQGPLPGGLVPDRYTWTQTKETVEMNLFVPEDAKAKDVQAHGPADEVHVVPNGVLGPGVKLVTVTETTLEIRLAKTVLFSGDWEFKGCPPQVEPEEDQGSTGGGTPVGDSQATVVSKL
eukprot:Skav232538  [mRNA]  locus=scaffold319:137183:140948:+ [translate_table: standard]